MLQDILNIIKRDRLISRINIARELDIPEDLVNDGLDQLLRMGYIVEDKSDFDCESLCSGCAYASSCQKELIKTFKLADRAEK